MFDIAAQFPDACAVQLPAKLEPTVPAPQMGEAGKTVEITYWRAAWQAVVDGRGTLTYRALDERANPTYDHDTAARLVAMVDVAPPVTSSKANAQQGATRHLGRR